MNTGDYTQQHYEEDGGWTWNGSWDDSESYWGKKGKSKGGGKVKAKSSAKEAPATEAPKEAEPTITIEGMEAALPLGEDEQVGLAKRMSQLEDPRRPLLRHRP